jgi:hypothetical protein
MWLRALRKDGSLSACEELCFSRSAGIKRKSAPVRIVRRVIVRLYSETTSFYLLLLIYLTMI